jgi:hypothetical protein
MSNTDLPSNRNISVVCPRCENTYQKRVADVRLPEDLERPSCSHRPQFVRAPHRIEGENRDDYEARLEAFIRRVLA